jgi:apolipoprotein N-acyltransferase
MIRRVIGQASGVIGALAIPPLDWAVLAFSTAVILCLVGCAGLVLATYL